MPIISHIDAVYRVHLRVLRACSPSRRDVMVVNKKVSEFVSGVLNEISDGAM